MQKFKINENIIIFSSLVINRLSASYIKNVEESSNAIYMSLAILNEL